MGIQQRGKMCPKENRIVRGPPVDVFCIQRILFGSLDLLETYMPRKPL